MKKKRKKIEESKVIINPGSELLPTITSSTADILKREAYSRSVKDDFLIDVSEYDIPNMETTMNILEETPTYTTAHYFGKELLNIITTETTMKDIFVLPPEKKKIEKLKEGTGYLLTKIKTIESYYVIQQHFKYNIPLTTNYYTIGNFLINLKLLLEMIDYYEIKKDYATLKWLIIILYKLLCKSFLSYNHHSLDEKAFFVNKGIVTLYLRKKKTIFLKSSTPKLDEEVIIVKLF